MNDFQEQMERLFALWHEADVTKRDAVLNELLHERFTYVDAHAPTLFEGPQGFAEFLEIFRSRVAGAGPVVRDPVQIVKMHGRCGFTLLRDGAEMATGTYFATLEDGKIIRLCGFVDERE